MLKFILPISFLILFNSTVSAQAEQDKEESSLESNFSDRQAILKATENFFIGDHTGSIEHKRSSMHEQGAYRYVSRDGAYSEFVFDLDSNDADTTYTEELLSIEIYGKLALVRLRLAENSGGHHYKLLTMHKFIDDWKITTITWGSGIIQ